MEVTDVTTVATSTPQPLLVVAALIIGKFAKSSKLSDEYIPVVVGAGTAAVNYLMTKDSNAVVEGFMYGFASVGLHQAAKQVKRKVTTKKKTSRKK